VRLVWGHEAGVMSRALVGRERTRARKAVAALAGSDPAEVARKLGMKRHSIAPLLDGRRLPGRVFAERAARLTPSQ
jgi:hypothetical protein